MQIMDNNIIKSNKRKSLEAATAMLLLSLETFFIIASVSTPFATTSLLLQSALAQEEGVISQEGDLSTGFIDISGDLARPKAPVVVSGDNIYIAWWTNNTQENGNQEVMFRASNDGGQTFGDKINLSNTTEADSWRVEVAGEGADVVVTWWETNQTNDTPMARVSTDGGQTFGPLLMLGMNGTLSSGEAEGEAVPGIEELLPTEEEEVPTEEDT
jgi:hypothetical protein